MRALQHGVPAGRCARRSALVCAASGKQLTGACVVTLTSRHATSCKVQRSAESDAGLQDYMSRAADNFANIQLPLGGKISRVDSSSVELVVPRFQLFDVWLQPKAIAKLTSFPGRIEFTSTTDDCGLVGSHHVKDFKLDERFNLDVRIIFQWKDEDGNTSGTGSFESDGSSDSSNTINAEGSITIEVDIPPPFSFMPKPVLTAAGNTALQGSTQIIMSAFTSSLARDYELWAKDAALRKKRQQVTAA